LHVELSLNEQKMESLKEETDHFKSENLSLQQQLEANREALTEYEGEISELNKRLKDKEKELRDIDSSETKKEIDAEVLQAQLRLEVLKHKNQLSELNQARIKKDMEYKYLKAEMERAINGKGACMAETKRVKDLLAKKEERCAALSKERSRKEFLA